MSLLTLNNISISFGTLNILDQAYLNIKPGQKIGLIGRNGEGKSTLLKIINRELLPHSGDIHILEETRIAKLDQDTDTKLRQSIFDRVASGLGDVGTLLSRYYHICSQQVIDDNQLKQLGNLQQQLDTHDGWNLKAHVDKVLSRLNLSADQSISELSGGWKRRVSLARALVNKPQLLLLDEPTNHLDMQCINWLEKQIFNYPGTVIFITHDRTFLQNIATDIVELDRGKLHHWPNNYAQYLRRKAALLEQEEQHNAEFDKKLAKEERWIKQGIKARRTRNEGRVRRLKKLRSQQLQRQQVKDTVNMSTDQGVISGKLVIDCNKLNFSYGQQTIVKDLSIRILRQDRVGLIGENGCGKSTLIKLLLKKLAPESGNVVHGTKLKIAYFDQHQTELPEGKNIIDIVAQGSDQITINGKSKHIISYLSDFLFSPQQSRAPIRALSGGERVRVRLARLFSQPANLLVIDEPTNDLDIETLELLEELLINYQGTLLLASHDRQFLDNVVTSTLSFSKDGKIEENIGGYSDWLKQNENKQEITEKKKSIAQKSRSVKNQAARNKLSYKLQRELEQLPNLISVLEQQQSELTKQISNPDFYNLPSKDIEKKLSKIKQINNYLDQHYERWNELESSQVN